MRIRGLVRRVERTRSGDAGPLSSEVVLIFETENEFLRPGITESAADHFFDIDRIMAQAFENFFLLSESRLHFRQPPSVRRLDLAQAVVFLPRLPEIKPRRRAHDE